MKSTRSIDKLLSESNSELAILITRTKLLRRLTRILRRNLDETISPHCYVASIEDHTLIILVDSAAWASKLRFYSRELLNNLPVADSAFAGINKIRIKILHQRQDHEPVTVHKQLGPHMNEQNARGLETLAENETDKDLQSALTRLAKNAKPRH